MINPLASNNQDIPDAIGAASAPRRVRSAHGATCIGRKA